MPKTQCIYKGRVFKVCKEKKHLPGGKTAEVDIVRHPGAVLIIPFLERDRVVLLRQFRPTLNRYLYELPAGTRDPGETATACAKREVIEETGFRATKMTRLGSIYPVPGYSTEKIVIFKAEGLKKSCRPKDADEIIETGFVTRSFVCALFKKGALKDAKTIAAFVFCGWL